MHMGRLMCKCRCNKRIEAINKDSYSNTNCNSLCMSMRLESAIKIIVARNKKKIF